MWYLIQTCLVISAGLFIVTQIIIPALNDKVGYFWSFRGGWNTSIRKRAAAEELKLAEQSLTDAKSQYGNAVRMSEGEQKVAREDLELADSVHTEAKNRKEKLDAAS